MNEGTVLVVVPVGLKDLEDVGLACDGAGFGGCHCCYSHAGNNPAEVLFFQELHIVLVLTVVSG